MTVARPQIQQFSGLQRPSKTSPGPLYLTHPGVSTGDQSSSTASFLCTPSAFRQLSALLSSSSPEQLPPSHASNVEEHLTLQCSSQKAQQQAANPAVVNLADPYYLRDWPFPENMDIATLLFSLVFGTGRETRALEQVG